MTSGKSGYKITNPGDFGMRIKILAAGTTNMILNVARN